MTSVLRVECQCGAMTFCQATAILPHACAFCGRALPDSTAARLRALRIGRGLSTRALAAHLGLARTTAYEWEAATSATRASQCALHHRAHLPALWPGPGLVGVERVANVPPGASVPGWS